MALLTMENKERELIALEKQFQELVDAAKEVYPDIENTLSVAESITATTESVQDYLNLVNQTPSQKSTNQITI